jgi:hypothetical protein
LAGAVSYTYTQGPDGRSYITGGEVPIHLPVSIDPEETLRNMEQVQRAALAPGNPSGQDMSVAGQAAAAAAIARQELTGRTLDAALSQGVSSVTAGLLFERLHGESLSEAAEGQAVGMVEELPDSFMIDPREAYGRSASFRGLWALGRGFERAPGKKIGPRFEIAA